ncbi:MAG: DUF4476 domain-containing protein [Bacteroidetes bacterium]|nr:DUF4476 domain-containing protein [Bacteroidota bacterium]
MLRNALTAILFLFTANCSAQQDYFVLIQADNHQPFYVRMNGSTYSSSDIGHLIIPRLIDTPQAIAIGFPKDTYPEENFVIRLNKKDQSFRLKNLGEKGWALFNTLSMELQMPVEAGTAVKKNDNNVSIAATNPAKRNDAFSMLMAGVVNDTSIMYNNTAENEPEKKTEIPQGQTATNVYPDVGNGNRAAAASSTNTPLGEKKEAPGDVVAPPLKEKAIAKNVDLQKKPTGVEQPSNIAKATEGSQKASSNIKIINELRTDSMITLTYVDVPSKGIIDTVEVAILLDKEQTGPLMKTGNTAPFNKSLPAGQTGSIQQPTDLDRDKIAASLSTTTTKTKDNFKKDTATVGINKTPEPPVNNNCKSLASDYDIDKIRVKMLLFSNDDDKIDEAREVFKTKCFSVKQVRALSEVFKTDEGKYKLLDAMYDHVSDTGNFAQLQDLLSEPYYIKRFKAMIR